MKARLLTVVAVGLFLGAAASRADGQADAKALLDKAMKAMGGEAKLAKLTTVSCKAKITGSSRPQITLDLEGYWQGLSQYRAAVEIQDGGNYTNGVFVVNGDKGWIQKMDKTEDAPEGIVPFIKNILYAARMPQILPALKDKAYKLSPLGEATVGTQTGAGLAISHKDFKDVSLFFDKANGLPIKSEIRLTEPNGTKEITVECHYSDYKDFDGLKLCSKIAIKVGDMEFTMVINELKVARKLDDSQFDRP